MPLVRIGITVSGRVQGVGFRYFTQHCAVKHHLSGWVRNCSDRSVTMEVQGDADALELFRKQINEGPILARVQEMIVKDLPVCTEEAGFYIRH